MSLTEHQTLNTRAPWFDVQYRYFAGPSWQTLIAAGLSSLAGWTAPDIGKPAGWTEITDRTSYASRFRQELRGASISWSAELAGWEYDDTLLGLGVSVLCWRRIYRPTGTGTAPAGWQTWEREFLGEFVTRFDEQDYRNGRAWTRTVAGYDNYLQNYNAPRITAGKLTVTTGAPITGNEELSVPAMEADAGEFVGGTADVTIGNLVDGNRNTVYISEMVPSYTENPWPGLLWDGGVLVSEIFFKPIAGWNPARTWWVECFNQRSQNSRSRVPFKLATHAAGVYTYHDTGDNGRKWQELSAGACCLFVANRAAFDQYTGADNNGAEFIIDVSQYTGGSLTDDAAVLAGTQVVAWAPGGAARDYDFGDGKEWHGATLDSSTLGTNESFLNTFGAGFVVNAYPHPGANNTGVGPVWIKIELLENSCLTLDEIDAATTDLRLDNYIGWVTPDWRGAEQAFGVIGGCVFEWLYRDANGLHGVTWVSAPAAPIPAGTRCFPYVAGLGMTGYPVTTTRLVRRRLPTIKHYKVFWSAEPARDYATPGWETDYYALFHEQQGNVQNLILTDTCTDGTHGYLWVRTVMYLIYAMTDGGRVKLNEIEVDLAQVALDVVGLPELDGADVTALAEYLWTSWCGLPAADFAPEITVGAHKLGRHATAITPVNKVYDDLARSTGCLVWYRPTGGIGWLDDPWWPRGEAAATIYTFEPADIRGAWRLQTAANVVDYVILNALSLEGEHHAVRYVYPQPPAGLTEPPVAALVREIGNRVIARDADAQVVAQMELERLQREPATVTIAVKGVGEWCRPGLKVLTAYDVDGDGVSETLPWLIESCVTERSVERGGQRNVLTTLTLRGFRG